MGFPGLELALVVLVQTTGDGPWSELDGRIAALASAAPGEERGDAMRWGGLVRAFWTLADDPVTSGASDVDGLLLEDVDVYLELEQGDVGARVAADVEDGSFVLEDAFGSFRYTDALQAKVGQFKPRVVRSASVQPGSLLFRERTFLGALFDSWDPGVEVGGHYDTFDYWLSVTNGVTGDQSDHFWSARGEWAFYGEAWEDVEGARGAPNHLRALLGGFTFSDVGASSSDAGGYGLDLAFTFGPYAFHAEWADVEEEFQRTVDVFDGAPLVVGGDAHPRSATFSSRIGEALEGALRWQAADDADDTTAFGGALDWFPAVGPVRWIGEATRVDADAGAGWILSIGVAVGETSAHQRPFSEL